MRPCSARRTLQTGCSAGQLAVSLQPNLLTRCGCPVVSIVRKCLSTAEIYIFVLLGVLPLCVKGTTSYGQWKLLFLSCYSVSHNFVYFADIWAAKAGKVATLLMSERIS